MSDKYYETPLETEWRKRIEYATETEKKIAALQAELEELRRRYHDKVTELTNLRERLRLNGIQEPKMEDES